MEENSRLAAHTPVTREALIPLLGQMRSAFIFCYDTVASTMDACRQLGEGGAPAGAVVLAHQQTQGQGRRGRDFFSPPGEGLYLSMLLRPGKEEGIDLLTAFGGLAVCRGIRRVTRLAPEIKWPNDVILSGRKVCGILTRAQAVGGRVEYAVVGVGVNVHQGSFPPELRDKAISLAMAGAATSRTKLAAAIIGEMDRLLLPLPAGTQRREALEELKARCCTLGREVRVETPEGGYPGRGVDITPGGALVVETPTGPREVNAGEVSVRGLLGYL